MMNKDPRAQTRICQKEMTDREEAVRPKNPCKKMQVDKKTIDAMVQS